jgi:hypothetical protein
VAKSTSGSTLPTRRGGRPRHTEVRFRLSEPSHTLTLDPDNPELWDFAKDKPADLVIINIGTNDQNRANNVPASVYADALTKLIQGVHGKYPDAQIIVMVPTTWRRVRPTSPADNLQSLWLGFERTGNTFSSVSHKGFISEIRDMIAMFNSEAYLRDPMTYDGPTKTVSRTGKKTEPFVHLFNTTGILQHNDIGPQWHPTDVGAIKVASHLLQYIKLTLGWELEATGPE